MKARYRGYEITVTRERSLGGPRLLYWSIFRAADAYEAASGFEDSEETVPDMLGYLKQRVDNELAEADPWEERAAEQGYRPDPPEAPYAG